MDQLIAFHREHGYSAFTPPPSNSTLLIQLKIQDLPKSKVYLKNGDAKRGRVVGYLNVP